MGFIFMNLRFESIQKQMVVYGGRIGFVGGGLLGAGFAALTYHPLHEFNILLIANGALATALVGMFYGMVSGWLSSIGVVILTHIMSYVPRFRTIYQVLASGWTIFVSLNIFFQIAYAIGQPYVFDTNAYPSWLWALILSIIGAGIVSTTVTQNVLSYRRIKRKKGYVIAS